MWAVTRSIKFQNKLAKEAIINSLKSRSIDMFQDGEMIIRAFTNITENSIEIFHLFKNKDYVNKQSIKNKNNLEAKTTEDQKAFRSFLKTLMQHESKAKQYLMKVSMLESLRDVKNK